MRYPAAENSGSDLEDEFDLLPKRLKKQVKLIYGNTSIKRPGFY